MPANPLAYLGAPDAAYDTIGVTRYATVAETVTPTAGTQDTTAVTPAGVAAVVIAGGTLASTTVPGLIQLATNAQAVAASATDRGLTPSNLTSVFAAPGVIGGTTPAAATFTNLTATGTISFTSGITVADGGTGLTSYTTGDLIIATGATTLASLAIGTARQVLQTNAGGTAPEWTSNVDLPGTLDVTGVTTLDDDLVAVGDVTITGLLTANGSANIKTAGTTLGLGSDNDTAAVNLGIGTSARAITVGGSGANTIVIGNTQTAGSITVGNAMTTGTITIGGATNTGILTLGRSTAAGGQTINIGNAVNTGAQVINIASGASAGDSSVNILAGNAASGTITLNAATGNGTKAINIGNGVDGNTITIGNGINTSSQEIDIANGASAANTTVKIMSGIGTAGAGTLNIGNNTRITTADFANIAPAASRTTTVAGGTVAIAAVTDTLNLGTGGATTNANSIKTVNINTGTVATGQVLTNIASGTITSGTHTTNLVSGNAAAGTVALNIMTGTGTKTLSVGNADGSTTIGIKGVVSINASQNSNTAINSGTSTGTVTIGNALSGAIALSGGSTVDIDAVGALSLNSSGAAINIGNDAVAQAINIGTGAAARTVTIGNVTTTSGTVINTGSGGCTVNGNLILGDVATQLQLNGGAATDFIGTSALVLGTIDVANTNIAATDRIFLQRISAAGSVTLGELTYSITPSTKFTVTSLILGTPASTQTADVSTFAYFIVRQN